jgi:hypothetical protein
MKARLQEPSESSDSLHPHGEDTARKFTAGAPSAMRRLARN